jgi:GT2 family glycosyltransferase
MQESSVAIIISNYNGVTIFHKTQPILKLCLESLKNTTYQNYKIILADDCSTDNSVEYLKFEYPYVDIMRSETRGGFSKNNNNAIKYAIKKYNPAYILLLNSDIIITDKDWIDKLMETVKFVESIGIVGSKLVYPDKKIQHAGIIVGVPSRNRGRTEVDKGQYDRIEEVDAVTGALFLINTRLINAIGLLDENFYMGFEDTDYCLRAKKAGYKVSYNGKVSAVHLEGFSSMNSPDAKNSDLRFYVSQVDYIYFALKHFGFIQRIGVLLNEIGGGIFTIEDKDKIRKLSNFRLRDRPLWRLIVSLKAIPQGYFKYTKS